MSESSWLDVGCVWLLCSAAVLVGMLTLRLSNGVGRLPVEGDARHWSDPFAEVVAYIFLYWVVPAGGPLTILFVMGVAAQIEGEILRERWRARGLAPQ